MTVPPPASITSVLYPARRRISRFDPTAAMVPSAATATADAELGSFVPVNTRPLTMMVLTCAPLPVDRHPVWALATPVADSRPTAPAPARKLLRPISFDITISPFSSTRTVPDVGTVSD